MRVRQSGTCEARDHSKTSRAFRQDSDAGKNVSSQTFQKGSAAHRHMRKGCMCCAQGGQTVSTSGNAEQLSGTGLRVGRLCNDREARLLSRSATLLLETTRRSVPGNCGKRTHSCEGARPLENITCAPPRLGRREERFLPDFPERLRRPPTHAKRLHVLRARRPDCLHLRQR